jgi:DNA repair ATPase RecN
VSSKLNELKNSNKELIDEHDKLEKRHNELTTRFNLLKDEYTTLKINHDSLVVANELLSYEPHDATNHVVKIDIATSYDDLIVESIEQGSSSKGKKWLSPITMMIMLSLRVKIRNLRKILRRPQPPTPL